MDLKLEGKKAIVTGGSRGIGHAIARRLALEGCRVGICARGAAGVDAVLAAFAAEGLAVIGAACDVADGEAVQRWTAAMAAALGGIDIVVANPSALAGANRRSRLAGRPRDRRARHRAHGGGGHAAPREVRGRGDRHRIQRRRRREFQRRAPLQLGQSRPHQLHVEPRQRARRPGHPGELRLAGHDLLRGRCLGPAAPRGPRGLRGGARPQPYRAAWERPRRWPMRWSSSRARSRGSPRART